MASGGNRGSRQSNREGLEDVEVFSKGYEARDKGTLQATLGSGGATGEGGRDEEEATHVECRVVGGMASG